MAGGALPVLVLIAPLFLVGEQQAVLTVISAWPPITSEREGSTYFVI